MQRLSRFLPASLLLAAILGCAPPEERAAKYLERAEALYEEGELARAKLEARSAAQIEPRNAGSRYLLARIAQDEREFPAMFDHLAVTVDADPGHIEARLMYGKALFFAQAFAESREQLKALVALAPDHREVILLSARHQAREKDIDAAVASFDRLLAKETDNIEVIGLKAGVIAERSTDDALALLAEALARLPADRGRPLRAVRALILRGVGRFADAEQEYRALMRDFPEDGDNAQALVSLLYQQGKIDEVDEVLRSISESKTADDAARLRYVKFLVAERRLDEARAVLLGFIETLPDARELRLALGEIYQRMGQATEARQLYVKLADEIGDSNIGRQAQLRIARLDLAAGDFDSVNAIITPILAQVPDEPTALELRAGVHLREGRLQEAIADLRGSLRRHDDNAGALLSLARAYRASGDTALAADTYRRLLTVDNHSRPAQMELARLLIGRNDLTGAAELLKSRSTSAPDDIEAGEWYSEVLRLGGGLDAAEREARRLLSLEGHLGIGDLQLGRVLAARGDVQAAIVHFEKAFRAQPDAPLILDQLVAARAQAGRNAENIRMLEAEVGKRPQHMFARLLLARSHVVDKQFERANTLLQALVKENPSYTRAWAALAQLYGERERRVEVYRQGLAANAGDPLLSQGLAGELSALNRYDEAIALYEQMLAANPANDSAAFNLANMLAHYRDDPESHARALDVALRFRRSSDPAVLDTLGWTYYLTGDYITALQLLKRAVAIRSDIPLLRFHLGMTYDALGEPARARDELQKALDGKTALFPGVDRARETLKRLEEA
jgi:tetratricopeptide (TPR) repeat protein